MIAAGGAVLFSPGNRDPTFGRHGEPRFHLELRRHDSNDPDCAIAELELFYQGGADGSEVSLREAVAENDYGVTAGLAFFRGVEAAEFRFHAQDVEEARTGDGGNQQPRFAVAADAEGAAVEY